MGLVEAVCAVCVFLFKICWTDMGLPTISDVVMMCHYSKAVKRTPVFLGNKTKQLDHLVKLKINTEIDFHLPELAASQSKGFLLHP